MQHRASSASLHDRVNATTAALSRAAIAVSLAAALVGVACTGAESFSTTAPSQVQAIAAPVHPAADPAPSVTTLRGRVTEAPPTSITEICPARVTILDGAHAGTSVETNPAGFYTIAGLQPGTFTVAASADGFVGATQTVNVSAETTANFQLLPVPETMRFVLRGDIRAADGADGTCSDGFSQKPCRIVTFPVHNPGVIEATLAWTSDAAVDLDLTLFQTRVDRVLTRSATEGTAQEQVRATVLGGVTYELHITWNSGAGGANYTLTLAYPN